MVINRLELENYLERKRKIIDEALTKFLDEFEDSLLLDAMRYSVFSGGKRFRPVLLLMTAEALGKDSTNFIPVACAIEMIHNFSLVHDDLPCMDNDDMRRGKPTTHKKYGEAVAVLAGDALIILAFQLAARCGNLDVIKELAISSGLEGMTGGQSFEGEYEGREIDEELLKIIHRKKTGSLIKTAVKCGAILAGANEKQMESLTQYSENLGLTYQIVDDILDSKQYEKHAGFPSIFGMERSILMAENYTRNAIEALSIFGSEADYLRNLARYLLERKF